VWQRSCEYAPDRERLAQLAEKLRFPIQFFFGDDLGEISPDIVSFRSMSKMTAGQRDTALGAGAIALLSISGLMLASTYRMLIHLT